LALDAPRPAAKGPYGRETLRIAVVRFPRISNFTDLDALACEPGVVVRYAASAGDLAEADLVVLPGTRATVNDLAWLRGRGMADEIRKRADEGRPVLGVCGGYQMLAEHIVDDVESKTGKTGGLALLPARVEFGKGKTLGRPTGSAYGEDVHAYEIHHGVVTAEGEPFLDGCRKGAVWGTTWHGAMENDGFRRAFLKDVARHAARDFTPAPDVSFAALREATLDALGDLVEEHLDTGAVRRIIERGAPGGLPVVPPGGPARGGGRVSHS
jgi:adenosylcobyric acid synthase